MNKAETYRISLKDEINQCILNNANNCRAISLLEEFLLYDVDNFTYAFKGIIAETVLAYNKSQRAMEIFNIIKKFLDKIQVLKNSEKIHKFVEGTVKFILLHLDTSDLNYRLGLCTIFLNFFPLEKWGISSYKSDVFSKSKMKVAELLENRSSKLRRLAIKCAVRLNMDKELLSVALYDPLKENRSSALSFTQCNLENISQFSNLLEDADEDMRILVLKKICDVGIDSMKSPVIQKLIIRYGEERCTKVRHPLKSFLFGFLEQSGIESFLDKVDIIAFNIKEQTILEEFISDYLEGLDLRKLEEEIRFNYIKDILEKSDNMGRILLCVIAIEIYNKKNSKVEDILNPADIIPLLKHSHPIIPHFFVQSVMRICMCLDIYEEFIRYDIVSSLKYICASYKININENKRAIQESYLKLTYSKYFFMNSNDVIKFSVKLIRKLVEQHVHEFFNNISEIISEIRDPLNGESLNSLEIIRERLNNRLNVVDDDIKALEFEKQSCNNHDTSAIDNEIKTNTDEAEFIEDELEEINKEITERIFRMLLIVTETLKEIIENNSFINMQDYIDNLIFKAIEMPTYAFKEAAYECLTQCILLDFSLYKDYQYLYKNILSDPNSYLELICIKGLFDIYCINKPARPLNIDIVVHDEILKTLIKYSQSSNEYIRALTLEGFCKLLLTENIDSVISLVVLLLSYLDTNEAPFIKQTVQMFFNNIDILCRRNSDVAFTALKVFIQINSEKSTASSDLEIINNAVTDIKKIMKLIWTDANLEFTKKSFHYSQEIDFLYFSLVFIMQNPRDPISDIYSKLIMSIEISNLNENELPLLLSLLSKILEIGENPELKKFYSCIIKKQGFIAKKNTCGVSIEHLLQASYNRTINLIKTYNSLFQKNTKITAKKHEPKPNTNSKKKYMYK